MYLTEKITQAEDLLSLQAAFLVFGNEASSVLMRGEIGLQKGKPYLRDLHPVTEDLTRLMYAPFLNIYDLHNVCFGMNPLPHGTTVRFQHAWETLFYATPFSHPGGTRPRWTLEKMLCAPFTPN